MEFKGGDYMALTNQGGIQSDLSLSSDFSRASEGVQLVAAITPSQMLRPGQDKLPAFGADRNTNAATIGLKLGV